MLLALQRITPQAAATWNEILEQLGVIFVLVLALIGIIAAIVRQWFAPWYVVSMLEKRIIQLQEREEQLMLLEQDIKQVVHEIRDKVETHATQTERFVMMRIGMQAGFAGDLFGADLLEQIQFQDFEIVRAEAGSNPPAVAAEILAAGLAPLIICRTIQQVEALPLEVMVEIGNEPDLAHFLERDFNGSIETWRAVSMAAVEQHMETGRTVYLGAVSNLNNRGLSFLKNLDWKSIPVTVGCSFHRYPEAGSYTAGHDGRSREQEIEELLRIVGTRSPARTDRDRLQQSELDSHERNRPKRCCMNVNFGMCAVWSSRLPTS